MRKMFAAAVVLLVYAAGAAQNLVDVMRDTVMTSHKVIPFGSGDAGADSVRRLVEMFYYDQFRSFSDPEAPYFLFMSRDAKLAMGIGGAVRMRAYYDWNGAMPVRAFMPYMIPMTPDATSMRHFDTTPAGTCLFFLSLIHI